MIERSPMQAPQRKNKKTNPRAKHAVSLLLLLALLAGGGALYWVKKQETKSYTAPQIVKTDATLVTAVPGDIVSIRVTPKGHENYVLTNIGGGLWLDGAAEPVDAYMAQMVFSCFSPLYAEETLSDHPDDYMPFLSEFGLQDPVLRLDVTYQSGQQQTLLIGDQAPETVRRYFLVSGDDHLYLCPDTLYDAFYFDYHLFFPINQPEISPTRVDRITVFDSGLSQTFEYGLAKGVAYQEENTMETVQNSFYLTKPTSYPVDSEWITPILTALNNFVLGPRHAEDTPENRLLYGLEEPLYTLTVHQNAGIDMLSDAVGQVTRVRKPEATYTFDIGPMYDEVTRFVASGGWIHRCNSFQLGFVYDLDPMSTLMRKPLNIPLEMVKALTVDGDQYLLQRTALLLENGDVKTDEDGNTLYNTAVTQNGVDYAYEDFEMRYEALRAVSVSGRLPSDFEAQGEVQRTIRIQLTTGETRVVTLMPFDAAHNAVGVDGVYLFYLIKGGLTF